MKVEGSAQEIRDLVFNKDSNLDQFTKLRVRWIVTPVVALILVLLTQVWTRDVSPELRTALFLVGAALAIWVTVSVQLRYNSKGATIATAVGSLVLLLLASGVITPIDLYKYLQDRVKKS